MTNRHRATRVRTLAGATAAALALAGLVGCGSDDESASDGGGAASSTTTTGKASFTGKPVTIMVSAPLKTPVADVPEIPAGAKAAARAINARGGLNGREVRITVCNDTDANAEVACARKAVREGILALTGSTALINPGASDAILEKAEIPSVATMALQNVQLSTKTNYPIDAPGLGFLVCPSAVPKVASQRKVATIAQNLPNQLESVKSIAAAAKASGADYAGDVVVPVSQSDFASAVQRLSDKGAEIVTTQLAPTALPGLVTAATSQGKQFAYCSSATNVPLQLLTQLGGAVKDFYAGSGFPPPTAADKYPLLEEFEQDMKAESDAGTEGTDPSTGLPINALRAWLGMHIIEKVSKSVEGELTSKALRAALDEATIDLGGVTPPLDFSKPATQKGFERFFNPQMRLIKWDPAKKDYVETSAEPTNIPTLLEGGAR